MKRKFREPLNQDDYWMGLAFMAAAASRSLGRQQGAVIVGPLGNMMAQGCDSPPRHMYDTIDYIRSAEKAVIQDYKMVFTGATIYITHTPNVDSVLDIIAADIRRIVYVKTRLIDTQAQEIARQAYIQLVEFKGNMSWMRDYISSLNSVGLFSQV